MKRFRKDPVYGEPRRCCFGSTSLSGPPPARTTASTIADSAASPRALSARERIPLAELAFQDQGDEAVHGGPGEVDHAFLHVARGLRDDRFDRLAVQVVGRLGGRGQGRRLEAVGLAAEHELEEHGIGGGEGHVAHALADQAGAASPPERRASAVIAAVRSW